MTGLRTLVTCAGVAAMLTSLLAGAMAEDMIDKFGKAQDGISCDISENDIMGEAVDVPLGMMSIEFTLQGDSLAGNNQPLPALQIKGRQAVVNGFELLKLFGSSDTRLLLSNELVAPAARLIADKFVLVDLDQMTGTLITTHQREVVKKEPLLCY